MILRGPLIRVLHSQKHDTENDPLLGDLPAGCGELMRLTWMSLPLILPLYLWTAMVFPVPIHAQAAEHFGLEKTAEAEHKESQTRGLELFRSHVRGLFIDTCVACHGAGTTEGRLDLTTRAGLLTGGERGPAIVVGRGSKSLITHLISHRQSPHMPKAGERLSEMQIATIIQWIDLGAPYDAPLLEPLAESESWTVRQISPEATSFWSFQPLQKNTPPAAVYHCGESSAIDGYVSQKLCESQVSSTAEAGRATLIRRVFFDVIGLPPSVNDVRSFVEDDREDAYERLIDRLLSDPHYGERWGRRWLDLVRFAESHGFEHDSDRHSAFHYRDFVVQALNQGMPYDQFVRWQIAGDELAPNERLAMMATGFLAAGVHSTQITQKEAEKHRYDEMDDMLSTIGTSMLGLSIGCARCHDHKFDPIPQTDYYRLLSSFTTTVRSEVELDFDPDGYERAKDDFNREHAPLDRAVRDFETQQLPQRFVEWRTKHPEAFEKPAWIIPAGVVFHSLQGTSFTEQPDASWIASGARPENDIWSVTLETKLRNVKSIRLETLAHSSLAKSGPGRATNGNFALSEFSIAIQPAGNATPATPSAVRLTSVNASFEQRGSPAVAAIDANLQTAWSIDPENGRDHAAVFRVSDPFGFESGTRVTITLKFGNNAHQSIGRPRISLATQSDLPPVAGEAITESLLTLLATPFEQLTNDEARRLLDWFKPQDETWQRLDQRRTAHTATAPRARLQKVLIATEGLPPIKLQTQGDSEFFKETHFLRRGETSQKEAVATQGFLQVLMTNPESPEFFQALAPPRSRTSFQRASLTNWLSDCRDGAGILLARVIVNRLWQHHIGRGIVSTPSDFGTRGERPSHPELLDFLAGELLRHRWELKPIHRRILSSRVYKQSCKTAGESPLRDHENRLFWHRPRRRLEAEVIRDALLAISGQLDDRLYGPGNLQENHCRRSLYFTVKRSHLVPAMSVFDAPDGTTPVADRPQTTVAPQALLLMNSAPVREAARDFATRLSGSSVGDLESVSGNNRLEEAAKIGYLTAVGRTPSADELSDAIDYLRQQSKAYSANDSDAGLSSALVDFCQVLFCLNEFVFVE